MDRNLASFSVSYMDDPIGEKRSGRQSLRYSGSSRPGYIGFILEISLWCFADMQLSRKLHRKCILVEGGWGFRPNSMTKFRFYDKFCDILDETQLLLKSIPSWGSRPRLSSLHQTLPLFPVQETKSFHRDLLLAPTGSGQLQSDSLSLPLTQSISLSNGIYWIRFTES